jgi:hypothetical protein
MKSSTFAFLPAFFALVAADACELEARVDDVVTVDTVNSTIVENATVAVFQPVPVLGLDRHSTARLAPTVDLPILPYASNTSDTLVSVNHTMKYPSILLEGIASVSNVDCSDTDVAITFNDSSVFALTQAQWSNKTFVLVTNHLGDCDAELERGFFLVDGVNWDNSTLIATATSTKSNINTTACTFFPAVF